MWAAGWEFKGELPAGRSRPCGDWDMGAMWECPFLQPLRRPPPPPQPLPGAAAGASAAAAQADAGGPAPEALAAGSSGVGLGGPACNGGARRDGDAAEGAVHVLCVSPYPHSAPDRPTNPCLYWLGALTPDDRFLIEEAQGAPPTQVSETWFHVCLCLPGALTRNDKHVGRAGARCTSAMLLRLMSVITTGLPLCSAAVTAGPSGGGGRCRCRRMLGMCLRLDSGGYPVLQPSCRSTPPPVLAGPERLDLGDVLYAPNAFVDARGRVLMLAWLQELRGGASGGFDYAGCLSLPRVLTLQGGSQFFFARSPL